MSESEEYQKSTMCMLFTNMAVYMSRSSYNNWIDCPSRAELRKREGETDEDRFL